MVSVVVSGMRNERTDFPMPVSIPEEAVIQIQRKHMSIPLKGVLMKLGIRSNCQHCSINNVKREREQDGNQPKVFVWCKRHKEYIGTEHGCSELCREEFGDDFKEARPCASPLDTNLFVFDGLTPR